MNEFFLAHQHFFLCVIRHYAIDHGLLTLHNSRNKLLSYTFIQVQECGNSNIMDSIQPM